MSRFGSIRNINSGLDHHQNIFETMEDATKFIRSGRLLTPDALREALVICEDANTNDDEQHQGDVVRAILMYWARRCDFIDLLRCLLVLGEKWDPKATTSPVQSELFVKFLREAIVCAEGMPRAAARDAVYGPAASARVLGDWLQRAQELLREFGERFDGSEFAASVRGRYLCELLHGALGALSIYPVTEQLRKRRRSTTTSGAEPGSASPAKGNSSSSSPPPPADSSWASRTSAKRIRSNLDFSTPPPPAKKPPVSEGNVA